MCSKKIDFFWVYQTCATFARGAKPTLTADEHCTLACA